MIANRNFEHCEPLTWVGRVPVYLATALAAVHGVALILSAVLLASGGSWLLDALAFSSTEAVRGGQVWQFFTYAFVYDQPAAYLWTAIQLFLLAYFGRDVEQFLGRKSFAWLYGALVLAGPVFLALLSIFRGSFVYAGSGSIHFAVFVAFVAMAPRAQIFFGLEARWLGLVLFAVNSLQLLGGGALGQLGAFWVTCGVAVAWMIGIGVGGFSLPSLSQTLKKKHSARKLRVVPKEPEPEGEVHDSIDPILEKIGREGIGSLTRAEREKLERARAVLLEKERHH